MADYLAMSKEALQTEKQELTKALDALVAKELKLDMSRGKPGPDQLDLSNEIFSITDVKDAKGNDTRNYGLMDGIDEAKEFFAGVLGAKPEEVLVGDNASLMLMYNAIALGWRVGFPGGKAPWKDVPKAKFLCPVPGYDRHFRVTEEFGFELVSLPMTPDGPDMDVMEELVKDEAVKGVWCVPVYSNPDGYTYSDETVRRMAAMKTAAPDFRIFWDNAYVVHHLYAEADKQDKCLNILEECRKAGNEDRPLMFCSTSKVTFAGAGVCAMAASKANMDAVKKYYFPMTIGFNKVNQLRHCIFFQRHDLAGHMQKHAAILRPKFQSVVDTLQKQLGSCGNIARWTEPRGGYFISLYVMDGCAKRVVDLCKGAGVVLTGAGAAYPYGKDPDDRHIRIAPSFPSPEQLALAAEVLCVAVRLASVEKLLA